MTFSITATPAQYAGANGESPAHVVVDIPTTEVITKITRTDSRGVTELFPDAARAIPNNYPGIGGAVVLRTNFVENPSFETTNDRWFPTGMTLSRTTSAPTIYSGGYALNMAVAGTGSTYIATEVPIAESSFDGFATFEFSARWSSGARWLRPRIGHRFDSGAWVFPSTSWGEYTELSFNASGLPDRYRLTVPVPAGADALRLLLYVYETNAIVHPSTAGYISLDAAHVALGRTEADAEAAANQYFDGATAAVGNLKYRWTGTANASPSEEYFSGWRVTDDGCPFETVTYTAYVGAGTQSVTVNNARPEMPVLLTTLTGGAEWVIAEQITDYTANRETGHVHHDVGDAFPLVTYGPRKLRTGTVGIYCSSHAEALKVEAVLTDHIALIRQHVPGLDLTVSVTRATLTPYEGQHTRTRWAVSVEYTEVVHTPVKRII